MGINRVNISGNLTREPELRVTQGGTAVLGFGVAVNDRRLNQQTQEWEDVPNFVDCTAFGNRANGLAKWLHKGTKVAIEGKLRWSQWESKDGSGKRSKVEVIVDDMELMFRSDNGGSATGNAGSATGQSGYSPAPTYTPQNSYQAGTGYNAGGYSPAISTPTIDATSSIYDEDIPF